MAAAPTRQRAGSLGSGVPVRRGVVETLERRRRTLLAVDPLLDDGEIVIDVQARHGKVCRGGLATARPPLLVVQAVVQALDQIDGAVLRGRVGISTPARPLGRCKVLDDVEATELDVREEFLE